MEGAEYMPRNKKVDRIFLSLILITGAMLSVALLSLGKEVLSANSQNSGVEKLYPELYVTPPQEYEEPLEKTVYFTFDDGPSKNTEVLLDLLQKEGVKATFFVCAQGEDTEYMQMLLRRMRDEGHSIGLHTCSHRYQDVYVSLEGYLDDLASIDAFVYEATGLHPNILRFPGGSRTANADPALMRQIAQEVTRRGYVFFDWTVPSKDDGATPAPVESITARIVNGVKERQVEIILCHDNPTPTTTPAAVEAAIAALREQGYRFDRLTHKTPPVQLINQK